MSSHPNTLLILKISPKKLDGSDELCYFFERYYDPRDYGEILIGKVRYRLIMTNDTSLQVSPPKEGVTIFTFLTYGYEDTAAWKEVCKKESELRAWAEKFRAEYDNDCTYEILLGSNFW